MICTGCRRRHQAFSTARRTAGFPAGRSASRSLGTRLERGFTGMLPSSVLLRHGNYGGTGEHSPISRAGHSRCCGDARWYSSNEGPADCSTNAQRFYCRRSICPARSPATFFLLIDPGIRTGTTQAAPIGIKVPPQAAAAPPVPLVIAGDQQDMVDVKRGHPYCQYQR